MGASSECITYAPWTGCHLKPSGRGKRERSPVLGGGLSPAERDKLIGQLARKGILFGRKLGVGGGSASGHNALIQASIESPGALPPAPPRLLPEEVSGTVSWIAASVATMEALPSLARWGLATTESALPLPLQISIGGLA